MSAARLGPFCPVCGEDLTPRAIKGDGRWVFSCPTHRHVDDWSGVSPRLLSCDGPPGAMDPEQRAWVLTSAFRVFLGEARDKDTLVIADVSNGDQYVQFEYHDGAVYGEVGSRQWDCPDCGNQPLGAESVWALSLAGFVGGGVHRNYSRDQLPKSPLELAALTEALFVSAYAPPPDFEVFIQPKSADTLAKLRLQMELEREGGLL